MSIFTISHIQGRDEEIDIGYSSVIVDIDIDTVHLKREKTEDFLKDILHWNRSYSIKNNNIMFTSPSVEDNKI